MSLTAQSTRKVAYTNVEFSISTYAYVAACEISRPWSNCNQKSLACSLVIALLSDLNDMTSS